MSDRKGANMLPVIHRFITNELGENYWFNGCGRYVMNALGETDYDYVFFAGITGDVFTQIYSYNRFRGDCAGDYLLGDGHAELLEELFDRCGYASAFVPEAEVRANRATYLGRLREWIDRGVPVISNLEIDGHDRWLVFVGYEEDGDVLLFMTDNMTQPERVRADAVFCEARNADGEARGLVFVGEKRVQRDLGQLYREALERLPALLTTRTRDYCFGAAAFRAWADELESGRYDGMSPEDFDSWFLYGNYICVLATNGCCCHDFLDRAARLNPGLGYIDALHGPYRRMQQMWESDPDGLEAIGGGFNITLEALQDHVRRDKIIAKIRDFADCADEALRILEEGVAPAGR